MKQRYTLSFRRQERRKERIKRIVALVVAVIAIIGIGALFFFTCQHVDWDDVTNPDKNKAGQTKKSQPIELTISCVGDIMAHNPQLSAAQNDGDYDFSEYFKYVKKNIKKSDLALYNLETNFSGEPYTGYPEFSAPDELANALKKAGFDVALNANNHTFDQEIEGLERTTETVKNEGMDITGSRTNVRNDSYLVKDVKGVKVGIVATTLDDDSNEEEEDLINAIDTDNYDEDMKALKKNIKRAKKEGAEIVICYFHWGDKYTHTVDDTQKEVAEKAVKYGADAIFGSHPHVLQEIDTIKYKGKKVPVFYSLGNFISNHRRDTIDSKDSEQGMIAKVSFKFDPKKKEITSIKYKYVPTWVDKYYGDDGDTHYVIIPLTKKFKDNETLETSGHLEDAEEALEIIKSTVKPEEEEDSDQDDS